MRVRSSPAGIPYTHPRSSPRGGRLVRFCRVRGRASPYNGTPTKMTGLTSLAGDGPGQRGAQGKDKRPLVRLVDAYGNDLFIPGTSNLAHRCRAGAIVNLADGVSGGRATSSPASQESSKTLRYHRRSATSGRPVRKARKPRNRPSPPRNPASSSSARRDHASDQTATRVATCP